jgi:hypothetical protein
VAVLEVARLRHRGHARLECELGMAYAAVGEPSRARRHLALARGRDPSCYDAAWTLATPSRAHRERAAFHRWQGLHAAAAEDLALARVTAA